jgi:hypothetical protein
VKLSMPILNSSRLVLNDKKATFWYRRVGLAASLFCFVMLCYNDHGGVNDVAWSGWGTRIPG